jgi:hypothetical protein
MWCGVQAGQVNLTIRRPHGPKVLGFSRFAKPTRPGAAGPLRSAVYRGTVTVAPGTR